MPIDSISEDFPPEAGLSKVAALESFDGGSEAPPGGLLGSITSFATPPPVLVHD